MGVSQASLDELDVLFTQQGKSMTHFCQTHLGGYQRDQVNYKQLSSMCVSRLDVPESKQGAAMELVESYLRCFAAMIC